MKLEWNSQTIPLVAGAGALVLSLLLTWGSISFAEIEGFPGMAELARQSGIDTSIGAGDMNIKFLFELPAWLVVCIGIAGLTMGYLNLTGQAKTPPIAGHITLGIATFFTAYCFLNLLFRSNVSPGFGNLLALAGLGAGIYALYFAPKPASVLPVPTPAPEAPKADPE